jgi:HK97 family phage prohead protease
MPRLAKIERKTEYFPIIGGEIKATNDARGIVEGYLNYIGNIDYGDDRTMPNAFDKTLNDSYSRKAAQKLDFLWPYLWNHSYDIPPPGGIFDADVKIVGGKPKGLYTKTQFNLDTQLGRELFSSFKSGYLKKQSMGYKAIQVDWVKEESKSIRNLLEVAVMEGSAVVFPMNDMAQVDTVKHRSNFYMPNKMPTKQEYPAMTKDYAASYAEIKQQDWRSDLWNLWYPLFNEIVVAFKTSEEPEEDVQEALKQFNAATLAYVQRGVELKMTEYLQPLDNSVYMSADDNPETKEGRALSGANHAKIKAAADGIVKHAQEIHDVLRSASLAQRQNTIAGTQLYAADDPIPEQKQDDAEPEDDATQLNKVREMMYDLASTLQFSNAAKGI